MLSEWMWLATLLTACGGPSLTCDEEVPQGPPVGGAENVLVLLLDDVGVDKVSTYGLHPEAPHTPSLDRLAAEGVRFDRAYAEPTCSPTRAALLTGRHPSRTGVGRWLMPVRDDEWSLPDEELTLPELLRRAPEPWSTAAVGKWHLTSFHGPGDAADAPNRQGFDTFRGVLGNPRMAMDGDGAPRSYTHWEKVVDGARSWSATYLTVDQVEEALELATTLPEPWLIYVAFSAAHEPFHVPPGQDAAEDASDADLYDRMVQHLDGEVGRLLDGIGAERLERTTVFALGDNGTPGAATRAPWLRRHAKETVFEAGVRVPWIVTGPRVTRPGTTSDALVHVTDVFATVADLAGVDVRDLEGADGGALAVDGRSLLPLLERPVEATERSCVMVEHFWPNGLPARRVTRAVIGRNLKFVRGPDRADSLQRVAASPGDEVPVSRSAVASGRVQALRHRLAAYERELE